MDWISELYVYIAWCLIVLYLQWHFRIQLELLYLFRPVGPLVGLRVEEVVKDCALVRKLD